MSFTIIAKLMQIKPTNNSNRFTEKIHGRKNGFPQSVMAFMRLGLSIGMLVEMINRPLLESMWEGFS